MKNLSEDIIKQWLEDTSDIVALTLRQQLEPVEGKDGVIFPPTYADIGYCIDELPDGTRIAQIDSVGSQANRMEPIFLSDEYKELVPQIQFTFGKNEDDVERRVSLLELAHRAGDAVVRSTTLASEIEQAFRQLGSLHDASRLAKLAPTSLVFGSWDSRGTQVKRPRLIRSVIRAEDVQVLHTAAQYNSIWKQLGENDQEALKKEAKAKKVKLSVQGFADAPSVWRTDKVRQFLDGKPNLDARVLGGIIANSAIYRQTTVNLIALRSLHGADEGSTVKLRRYLLGLTLVAATADMELYLREGCLLRYSDDNDEWRAVRRRGKPEEYSLSSEESRQEILVFAKRAASEFGVDTEEKVYEFDIKKAKQLLTKKDTFGEEE